MSDNSASGHDSSNNAARRKAFPLQSAIAQQETSDRTNLQRDSTAQKSVYIVPGNPEKETYRLSTYLKFPAITPVDVIVLARHGFYYTGYKDRVKCFSCESFKHDFCPQDDPRLASWHLQGCKFVLGTESSNKPIGNYKPDFVGTFSSSLPSSDSGSSSNLASSESVKKLFPSYPITSPNMGLDSASVITSSHSKLPVKKLNLRKEAERIMVLGREHGNILLNRVVPTLTEPADPSPEEKLRLEREFPCLHPVNPHMREYEERLQTFDQRWPSHKVLATKEHIAKAGFFFLGERYQAKCWYCNCGLQSWNPNDEPFTEHAKCFPGCEYMLRCKGVNFVRNIIQQFPNFRRPTLRRPLIHHRTNQLINSAPARPSLILNAGLIQSDTISSPEVRSPMITENPSLTSSLNPFPRVDLLELQRRAKEAGIAKEQIQQGIRMIKNGEREFRDANEFVNFLIKQQPAHLSSQSFAQEIGLKAVLK